MVTLPTDLSKATPYELTSAALEHLRKFQQLLGANLDDFNELGDVRCVLEELHSRFVIEELRGSHEG